MRQSNHASTAIVFAATLTAYLYFLCPTLYSGDSPLLTASAFALGPAHAPGYPLYVMLGKAASLIPIGSIAFKLNFLSALSGAAAATLVFLSVLHVTGNRTPAAFAAVLAALAPLAWQESLKAEVYTLNAALVMAVFYLGLRHAGGERDSRLLMAAAFVLGLAMGNHHTAGFMVFPLAVAALAGGGISLKDRRTLALCAVFFIAGMSVYLLSYIRSIKYMADEALFAYSDSSTLQRLYMTFFRTDYGSSMGPVVAAATEPARFLRGPVNAVRYLLFTNMGWLGLLGALSVPLLIRRRAMLGYMAAALAAYAVVLAAMVYAFNSPREDDLFIIGPYLLPGLYILAVMAGSGLSYITRPICSRMPSMRKAVALGAVLLPVVMLLPTDMREHDLRSYHLAADTADNILLSMPPGAVVLGGGDSSHFPLAYKSLVERKREDVFVLNAEPQGLSSQAFPRWRAQISGGPLKAVGPFKLVGMDLLEGRDVFAYNPPRLPAGIAESFGIEPHAQTYRLIREGEEYTVDRMTGFRETFSRLVYERSLSEHSWDLYSRELRASLFTPMAHMAYLAQREGDTAQALKLLTDALRLATGEGLMNYAYYLKSAGNRDEAAFYVLTLETYQGPNPLVRQLAPAIRDAII